MEGLRKSNGNVSSDTIKQLVEERILSGHYTPGYKLNERDLAFEFGVSRTPIRDIIARLSAEGLVEHKPRQGAYVKKNSIKDVLNWLEILAVLESSCARMAARFGNCDDAISLMSLADHTVFVSNAQDQSSYTKSNSDFHEKLYEMSNNDALIDLVQDIRRKIEPYREHIHRIAGMTSVSAGEHLSIATAISERDESKAADLMFQHLDMQRKEFMPFVSTLSKTLGS